MTLNQFLAQLIDGAEVSPLFGQHVLTQLNFAVEDAEDILTQVSMLTGMPMNNDIYREE